MKRLFFCTTIALGLSTAVSAAPRGGVAQVLQRCQAEEERGHRRGACQVYCRSEHSVMLKNTGGLQLCGPQSCKPPIFCVLLYPKKHYIRQL